ncbi:MAG: metal-dependent hydrolase [Acidobacteriota bacterium]|nr:metal-dependent hydrolase [Acidobacteriota bacterium]
MRITWLGHSAFIVEAGGKRILLDPWISNPSAPAAFTKPAGLGRIDLILVSHGHSDHVGDLLAISRHTAAPIVCLFELGQWLEQKGVKNLRDMGIGGTQDVDGVRVTMTSAVHSGSTVDNGSIVYLGGAAGFVVQIEGEPTFYFAGDTALFGDMRIIRDLYAPQIAFLPIGGHYTMGPDTAAIAADWLGVKQVVPMHWGTFPVLAGTPGQLRDLVASRGIDVLELEPGVTSE